MTAVHCIKCRCSPCSCRWVKKLMNDPDKSGLRRIAALMVGVPLPVVDGERTYHFGGCPCPKCYSLRDASYSRGADRPYPTPPERDSWPQMRALDEEESA